MGLSSIVDGPLVPPAPDRHPPLPFHLHLHLAIEYHQLTIPPLTERHTNLREDGDQNKNDDNSLKPPTNLVTVRTRGPILTRIQVEVPILNRAREVAPEREENNITRSFLRFASVLRLVVLVVARGGGEGGRGGRKDRILLQE